MKDYYGAVGDYTKAIEINPNDGGSYRNRGIAKNEIGDMKGACEDWRKAASLGESDTAKWVEDYCY